MAQFLLELLTEDIPARMQARAADDLKRLFCDALKAEELGFEVAEAHVTPRRLTLVIEGLPTATEARTEERRGPRVDAPEQALQGFMRGNGLSSLDEAEQRETPKGTFWFAVKTIAGRNTADVLPDLIIGTVEKLPWPKSMRWGAHRRSWVRPLRGILAVFDGKPVPGALPLNPGEIAFSTRTVGHRFHAPHAFEVTDFAGYRDGLLQRKVIIDREQRKRIILEQAGEKCGAQGLRLVDDPGLLDEVCGLVEWPVVYLGAIDPRFMDLPPEVRATSMRTHQKYFATETEDCQSAPFFMIVANVETEDDGKTVIAGNEKVLRARLADAQFFWDQDRKRTLESRLPDLEQIKFHEKLGSMREKAERISKLAAHLATMTGLCDPKDAARAALLAKADLTSSMVYEFPELQGIMGGYYARHDAEKAEVALAIGEHYRPVGLSDLPPSTQLGKIVAIADKLDSMVAFFSIDEKPTGSGDPFALRRAALGVVRTILENDIRIDLEAFLASAGLDAFRTVHVTKTLFDEVIEFISSRLKVRMRDIGKPYDLIDAVYAAEEADLVRLVARVDALGNAIDTEDGRNLLAGYKRAANILRIESKKDDADYNDTAVDNDLLQQAEETALADALGSAEAAIKPLFEAEDFTGCMAALAKLRAPIDAFFDQVTVNADDPALRRNRLALLAEIKRTIDQIADFSKIEG